MPSIVCPFVRDGRHTGTRTASGIINIWEGRKNKGVFRGKLSQPRFVVGKNVDRRLEEAFRSHERGRCYAAQLHTSSGDLSRCGVPPGPRTERCFAYVQIKTTGTKPYSYHARSGTDLNKRQTVRTTLGRCCSDGLTGLPFIMQIGWGARTRDKWKSTPMPVTGVSSTRERLEWRGQAGEQRTRPRGRGPRPTDKANRNNQRGTGKTRLRHREHRAGVFAPVHHMAEVLTSLTQ